MTSRIDPMDLPPKDWEKAMRRMGIVEAYLDGGDHSAAAAMRAAARLGVALRSFYRMTRAYSEMRQGRRPPPSRQGRLSKVDGPVDTIATEVVAEMWPLFTEAEINREVARRCRKAGLPTPSLSAVRTRTKNIVSGGPVDLRIRFGRDCDLFVDACPLEFDVADAYGGAAAAVLVLVLNGASGSILGHSLSLGAPSTTTLMDAMDSGAPHAIAPAEGVAPLSIAATPLALAALEPIDRELAAVGLVVESDISQGLRVGLPAAVAVGRSLGRARLAPGRNIHEPRDASVTFATAKLVIDRLIARLETRAEWDAELASILDEKIALLRKSRAPSA